MKVEIWFYADSYRKDSAPFGENYRPHLVIKGSEDYLGVQFADIPRSVIGEHITCEIKLLYEKVDYTGLNVGVSFDIREGPHVVGEGFVISLD